MPGRKESQYDAIVDVVTLDRPGDQHESALR